MELIEHCRKRMAAFKRPRVLHVVDALPKTATGKVRRYLLRAQVSGPASTAPPTKAAVATTDEVRS
jgi:acyl-coenzyme A synthetase/AMP-(fatty) acid ligase